MSSFGVPGRGKGGDVAFLGQGGMRLGCGVGLHRPNPCTHKEGTGSDDLGRGLGLPDEPAEFVLTAS